VIAIDVVIERLLVERSKGAEQTMRNLFYFGQLLKEIDCFAFPRTGSHFFQYCTSGLFDLITRSHAHLANAEAIGRQQELNPEVLYGLDLREPGVAYQPVWINGGHGRPIDGGNPVIVLIRNPFATAYSLYRVNRDRWHGVPNLDKDNDISRQFLTQTLQDYFAYYSSAFDFMESLADRALLIRYEELVASAEPLTQLVTFCGLKPKLQPEFVHFLTRFEHFAKPSERTFYRSGNDEAWRQDTAWLAKLDSVEKPDFSRFGY